MRRHTPLEEVEFLRALYEAIPSAVFAHEIDAEGQAQSYFEVNDFACQLLGYSRDDLLRLTPRDIFKNNPPDEPTLITKTGQLIPVTVRTQSFTRQGRSAVVSIYDDISHRKRLEDEHKSSEERFRWMLENSKDALYRRNYKTDVYEYMSPAATEITGYTPEELLKMPVLEVMAHLPAADVTRVREILDHAVSQGGGPTRFEYQIRRKDGQYRWVDDFATLFTDAQGLPLYSIGSVRDITERKLAEEAVKNSERVKTQFLDIAAHELRTPITAFSLLIQLSQKQVANGQPVEAPVLDRIRGQARRLASLVDDLLNVSRLERGTLTLRPARANLVALINESLEYFRDQFQDRRFTFKQPDQAVFAVIDTIRIQQVLTNLIDNAIKYTPQDSAIEISVEQSPESDRVSVTDHGPGIPQAEQANLFTRFFRARSDQTARFPGLGLGLFICRSIVELHGGSIGVRSEPTKGSTFFFELPRKVSF